MKLSILVATILILTILPSCSSEAAVPSSPAPEESQASTQSPTLEETPAEFTISDLSVTPIEVEPNERVEISAVVTNSGGSEGSYVVILNIDGWEESREAITIEAGKSETVYFSVTRDKDGSYEISIDDKLGQFTVSTPTPIEPYTGPLFDCMLHTRNILPQYPETLLSYLDRENVDWAICFHTHPESIPMPIISSMEDRVVMLFGASWMLTRQFSEAEMRRYLQPQGSCWGFGELGLWQEDLQSVTFDSPQMQTIFQLVNELKGIVMIHMSGGQEGERPTELTEIEPSICKYPDAIFLFHSLGTFDVVAQLMSKYPNVYYNMDFTGSFRLGKGISVGAAGSCKNAEDFLAGVNRVGIDYIVERNLRDLAPLLQQYPDRIFWGTDFSEPWSFDESVTDVVVGISRQFIGRLPADIQEKYAYQNAQRVFGRFFEPNQ